MKTRVLINTNQIYVKDDKLSQYTWQNYHIPLSKTLLFEAAKMLPIARYVSMSSNKANYSRMVDDLRQVGAHTSGFCIPYVCFNCSRSLPCCPV